MNASIDERVAFVERELDYLRVDITARLFAEAKRKSTEETPMAVPQIRGFATRIREMRENVRNMIDTLDAQVAAEYGGLADDLAPIQDEVKEVRALRAEIRGDMALNGNGGPPLGGSAAAAAPASPGPSAPLARSDTSGSGGEPRGSTFNNIQPAVPRPSGT